MLKVKDIDEKEYQKLINELIESGRVWDAISDLMRYSHNYTMNIEMAFAEYRNDVRYMSDILESNISTAKKLATVRDCLGVKRERRNKPKGE